MSHSSEINQTKFSRRKPNISNEISEHVRHLAEELEIESADGLDGNEMEVIALIRNCPLLYDKSLADFNDSKKKDQAWRAIGEVFNVSSRDVQQFWDSLKQSFVKYSADVNSNVKTYPSYLDEMQFLNSVNMRSRKPSCSSSLYHEEESDTSASSESDVSTTREEFSNLNVDALIEKVRANPILYDRKHREAKNHDLKLKTWKRLAKEMGLPVSECVNEWKILREKYGRERRFRKAYPDGRKWYLFEKLSFLENHIFRKKYSHTQMPARSSKAIFNNNPTNPSRDDAYSSSTSLVSDLRPQSLESRGPKKQNADYNMRSKGLSTRHYFDSQNGTRNDAMVSNIVEESLGNEDRLFALKIAAELKNISNTRKKKNLKADICKLLQDKSDA